MPEEDFDFSFGTLRYVFLTGRNVLMWAPALALAVVLRVITHQFEHQLIFPMCKCPSRPRPDCAELDVRFACRLLDGPRGVLRRGRGRAPRPRCAPREGVALRYGRVSGVVVPFLHFVWWVWRLPWISDCGLIAGRLQGGSMGRVLGGTADAARIVSAFVGSHSPYAEKITSRLFFNILHPPLNVPALGTWWRQSDSRV